MKSLFLKLKTEIVAAAHEFQKNIQSISYSFIRFQMSTLDASFTPLM